MLATSPFTQCDRAPQELHRRIRRQGCAGSFRIDGKGHCDRFRHECARGHAPHGFSGSDGAFTICENRSREPAVAMTKVLDPTRKTTYLDVIPDAGLKNLLPDMKFHPEKRRNFKSFGGG